MAYDGTLKFDTSLDASGVQKGASKLGDIVEGLGIFEILKKGVDMIAQSVEAAMGRLDTMDQFNRVMTTMTGSVDTANAALSDTNEIVAGTAYGLDTAAAGVQAFVSAGMKVQNATDTMAAWADATSFYTKGTNSELETVSNALQKMQTKGTVTMEHLQMLLEAGIPAVQIYADAVGMSTDEVTAAMGRGELRTSDFIAVMNTAFSTGTSGFPAVAGAAKKAGASWSGSMDNMRAAITRGTAAILEQLDASFNVKAGMVAAGKGIEQVLKGVASAIKFVCDNAAVFIPIGIAVTAAIIAMNQASVAATIANAAHTISIIAQNIAYGVLTIAIGIASAAQWVFNGAVGACPLMWLVMLIALVIAGVMALATALCFSSDAYKEQKEDVEALGQAEEDLRASQEESASAFEKTKAELAAQSQECSNLVNVLSGLVDANGNITGSMADVRQTVVDLNSQYEGLNLSIDEEGNSISATTDQINEYIAAKQTIAEQDAYQQRRNELLTEQATIEAQLAEIQQKKLDIANDESMSIVEKGRLIMDLNDTEKDYMEDQEENARNIEANGQLIEKSVVTAEQAVVNAYEAMNGAVDDNGKNIKQLAKQYGLSTDEILRQMKAKGQDIAAWSASTAAGFTKEGYSLEQVAQKWGMTAKEVRGYMDEWGMGLDDFNEEMLNSHTKEGLSLDDLAKKWGTTTEQIQNEMATQQIDMQEWSDNQEDKLQEWQDAVSENTDAVVNDFEELPTKMDVSLGEMIDVMNKNAETMAEWDGLLKAAEGILSPDVIAMLKEQGTSTVDILKEAIADPGKAAELNAAYSGVLDDAIVKANGTTGEAYALGEDVSSETAAGVTSQKSEVEKQATTVMADTLGSMSSTIFENTSRVTSAIQTLCTQMIVGLKQIKPRAVEVMKNVMTAMATTMSDMSGQLYNKATEIANGVINRMNKAFDIHSPSRVMENIFTLLIKGGIVGMDDEKTSLYDKVDEITGGVLSRFGAISDESAFAMSGQMQYAIAGNQAAIAAGRIGTYGGVQVLERTKSNTVAPNITVNNNVDAELVGKNVERAIVRKLGV